MKTRCGFVSNSSSSSFIVGGFLIKGEMEQILIALTKAMNIQVNLVDPDESEYWEYVEALEEQGFRVMWGSDMDIHDGHVLIGESLFKGSNSDGHSLPRSITDMKGFMQRAEELAKALGVPNEPKIYTGTEVC